MVADMVASGEFVGSGGGGGGGSGSGGCIPTHIPDHPDYLYPPPWPKTQIYGSIQCATSFPEFIALLG